ncbi:MAG: alpha-L-fucosidase [Clostridia bacterium]|nr:alpha-L-fucosidase [Clostridia bacterium]
MKKSFGIAQIEIPQWLKNDKFGIYTHWGVYSVHASGPNTTWYSHHLYRGGERERKHFEEHFGPFGKKGYTDLIPLFKAERFDADEWAEVFASSGARFAGPVAIHHDGFAMWKTDTTPFNCFDMGPKRDVTGELEKAIRRCGMRFMTAFHHAENYWFIEAMPGTDGEKAENEYLFSKKGKWDYDRFCRHWLNQCEEVFEKYSPDLIWFDFGVKDIPDAYKQKMIEKYSDMAEKRGIVPALCYKNHDFIPGSGIIDIELGRYPEMRYHNWITDTTVDDGEAWGYMENAGYKDSKSLIHYLIDNVSKNGFMLLNVGPKADGTIPCEVKKVLREMGDWLKVNGAAIFDTHPWYAYGEGPTKMQSGGMFSEGERLDYTPCDIRYTAKENFIYALVLARGKNEVVFNEVAKNLVDGEIEAVYLLGYEKALNYRVENGALMVEFPIDAPVQAAYCFKIVRDKDILEKDL